MQLLFNIWNSLSAYIWLGVENVFGWRPSKKQKLLFGSILTVLSAVGLFITIYSHFKSETLTKKDHDNIAEICGQSRPRYNSTYTISGKELATQCREALMVLKEEGQKSNKKKAQIEQAFKKLQNGEVGAAKSIFKDILGKKEEEGARAYSQAARAACHLGAVAYLEDSNEAVKAFRRATQIDPSNPAAWLVLGELELRIGNTSKALEAYKLALSHKNNIAEKDAKIVEAEAIDGLGAVHFQRGDLKRAKQMTVKALFMDKGMGRAHAVASHYGNLGIIYRFSGDLDRAEQMHRAALSENKELDSDLGVAREYSGLANVYHFRGDFDLAIEMFNNSLQISERLKNELFTAQTKIDFGAVHLARRDYMAAEEMFKDALRVFEKLNDKNFMAILYNNLGVLSFERSDPNTAEQMFVKSLAINEKIKSKEGIARNYSNLGLIAQRRHEIAKACGYLRMSYDLFREVRMNLEVIRAKNTLVDLDCPRGD